MKNIRILYFIATLSLLATACTHEDRSSMKGTDPEEVHMSAPKGARSGRVIIKLCQSAASISEVEELIGAKDGNYRISRAFPYAGKFEQRHIDYGLDRWYIVEFAREEPLTKAYNSFSKIKGIEHVEYDYEVIQNKIGFNDPWLHEQWHYINEGSINFSLAGSDMNVADAWEVETGSPEVIVAVCDGGVDYNHEDLRSNMWTNEAERNGTNGVDDDHNGYVDDIYGFNFTVADGSDMMKGAIEPESHGTHVAGTIGAVNNNGTGVAGMAGGNGNPDSGIRIMSVQTSPGAAYIGAAISYAADNGAVLINCSWSIDATSTPEYLLESFNYFNDIAGTDGKGKQIGPMKGGVLFFAAGNDNTQRCIPAIEDCVQAIASIGADYQKAYYSNFGDWIDLTATGGDAQKNNYILSTVPNNGYDYMQGTSMACPHATGAAALVVSRFQGQGFTREHLLHILNSTADPIIYEHNPAYAGKLGYGLIDTGRAVRYSELAPKKVTQISVSARANEITVKWTVPGNSDDNPVYRFKVFASSSSLEGIDPKKPGSNVLVKEISASQYRPGAEMMCRFENLDLEKEYNIAIVSQNMTGEYSALSEIHSVETVRNRAPEIVALGETAISLRSHESGEMRFRLSDAENHPISYTVSPSKEGVSCSLKDDILSIKFDALMMESSVTHKFKLTVSDSYDATTLDLSVEVMANNAPFVSSDLEDIVFNSTSDKKTIDLSAYFGDADGEQLNFRYSLKPATTIVKAQTSGNGMTISAFSYGDCVMTITASDGRSESVTSSFRILVREGSEPLDLYPNPVVDKLNIRTPENTSLNISLSNKAGAIVLEERTIEAGPFDVSHLDMSGLESGVYYLKVKGSDISKTYSIVKK